MYKLKEAELCFVMLWEVMGGGGWDCTGISLQVQWVCNVRGEEPLSNVASYCTCTLSNAVLSGTPLLQEAKSAMEESRSLRTRIHLADAAQKQARGMEMDYEEVIHLLEAEIAEMKSQKSEQPGQGKVFHFESFTLSLTIPSPLQSTSPAKSHSGFFLSRVLHKVGHCLLCIIQ